MYSFNSKEEHIQFLETQSILPKGFRCAVRPLEFFPAEKELKKPLPMNLTLISLDEPSASFAGLFTRNSLPGHPVEIGRNLLKESFCRGILINNKISNVFTQGGRNDSLQLKDKMEELLGGEGFVLPSSTGIIGWKLPLKEMLAELPALKEDLQEESLLPAARGIMTTDAFPKVRTCTVGNSRISAIAKGAGMIEPNMATMLVFILTDADLPGETLQECLKEVCDQTFNRLSIDSDQSTSDSAFLLSSAMGGKEDPEAFKKALLELCHKLADDLVRNGEGTGHVIEVQVKGAPSEETALGIAKNIVNSPLSKTAIYGNDPNVGRFLQSLGDYCGNQGIEVNREELRMSLGGEVIVEKGAFTLNEEKELRLSRYLKDCSLETPCPGYPAHGKRVLLEIHLGQGKEEARVLGSDLSYEYVHENADYRS